jgi:hypothetical protein
VIQQRWFDCAPIVAACLCGGIRSEMRGTYEWAVHDPIAPKAGKLSRESSVGWVDHQLKLRCRKPTNVLRFSSHKRKVSDLKLPNNVTGLIVLKKGSAS